MQGQRWASFFRQLASLLDAGLTPKAALDSLARQAAGGPARVANRLADEVALGHSLSDAAARQDGLFSDLQLALMRAGEASGRLPAMLAQIGDQLEARDRLLKQLVFRLVYPAILLHVGVFANALVGFFLADAATAAKSLLAVLLPLYGGAVLLFLLCTVGRKVAAIDRALDYLAWYLPLLAGVTRNLARARFAAAFEALYRAGVDAREGVRLAIDAAGNQVLAKRLGGAVAVIANGEAMDIALTSGGAFDDNARDLIRTGVRGGRLEEMMARIKADSEYQAERAINRLGMVLPGLVYLLVVVWVAIYIISIFGHLIETLERSGLL